MSRFLNFEPQFGNPSTQQLKKWSHNNSQKLKTYLNDFFTSNKTIKIHIQIRQFSPIVLIFCKLQIYNISWVFAKVVVDRRDWCKKCMEKLHLFYGPLNILILGKKRLKKYLRFLDVLSFEIWDFMSNPKAHDILFPNLFLQQSLIAAGSQQILQRL